MGHDQKALKALEAQRRHRIELSVDDLKLIAEALDSHLYWQLSDEDRRDSGYVQEPYTDEERACMKLEERVQKMIPTEEST